MTGPTRLTYEYEPSLAEVREAFLQPQMTGPIQGPVQARLLRARLISGLAVLASVTVLCLMLTGTLRLPRQAGMVLLFTALAIGFGSARTFVALLNIRKRSLQIVRKSVEEMLRCGLGAWACSPAVLEVDEEGYSVTREFVMSRTEWPAVTGVMVSPNVIGIYTPAGLSVMVPRRVFRLPREEDEFLAFVRGSASEAADVRADFLGR